MRIRSGNRPAFTLVEMLVAMTLLMAILGISTQLFRRQSAALSAQAGRTEAQQNGSFTLGTLDRDLRVAGAGVVDAQPLLVQAAPMAITFNADLVTRTPGDPGAVYIDTDAESGAAGVFPTTAATTLPTSSVVYPETTYMKAAGVPSGAETISFWISRDSTSPRSDDYVMFRRVNGLPPRVVARGLRYEPTDTLFEYFKADTAGALQPIGSASLPLYHGAMFHGSPSDTGAAAIIDSIRTVRVRLSTVYHDGRGGDAIRRLDLTIHLMNAGLIHRTTCGEAPFGVSPSAVLTDTSATVSSPYVTVSWSHALDDGGGEKDVERYAVYRRASSSTAFSEPLASVPAGATSYAFVDSDVRSGDQWVYGVAAQDCTPSSSPIGATAAVVIP